MIDFNFEVVGPYKNIVYHSKSFNSVNCKKHFDKNYVSLNRLIIFNPFMIIPKYDKNIKLSKCIP